MADPKYWVPYLQWDSVVTDSPAELGGDPDTNPDIRGIHAGVVITATLSKGDIRAIRALTTPEAKLFAVGQQKARLDDGVLSLTATQEEFGLLAKSSVLDLDDDVDIIYEFRFEKVTYNGGRGELPTITVKAPVVSDDYDPEVSGPFRRNLATMEWLDVSTARAGGYVIRQIPDEWTFDSERRLRFFADGEEVGLGQTVPFDEVISDELGTQVPPAVAAEVIDAVPPAVNADLAGRNISFDAITVEGNPAVQPKMGGANLGTPYLIPSATWDGTVGRPEITQLSLREWVSANDLPNDGDSDARSLFVSVINDLTSLYNSTEHIHQVVVPGGDYAFGGSGMQPPLGGGFGIKGEGMYATRFFASPMGAWMGMSQFQFGNPDFQWENLIFEDFTIDGSAQPVGSSYSAALKGFSMNNARNIWLRRVRVFNTHATGFGFDYCDQLHLLECLAEYCGRARLTHSPLEDRFGSGAGFGFGFGKTRDEFAEAIGCVARNNGSAGFFAENLDQPEASKHATGMSVIGGLAEGNAIGINDVGTEGSRYRGTVLRNNLLAGMRIGNSIPGERGGKNGIASDLTIYGNQHGVILDGNADSAFSFHDLEISENAGHGVWIRNRDSWAYQGRNKFRSSHIHGNGGCGVFADTTMPIPEFELCDNDIHNNGQNTAAAYRDEVCFLSPLASPKIKRNRIRGGHGYALALRGSVISTDPQIGGNDLLGSAGGSYLREHTVLNTDGITTDNLIADGTVAQLVARPIPYEGLTSWTGGNTTRTRVAGGPTINGVAVGWHIEGVATSNAPRITIPAAGSVTPGEMVMCSIYAKGPAGKMMQPHSRMDTTFVYGAPVRATGDWQRVNILTQVQPGVTGVSVGVIGIGTSNPWQVGDVIQATAANVTKGVHLWPFIDGDRPHCFWDGTAYASTQTLTIPESTEIPPVEVPVVTEENSDELTNGEANMPRHAVVSASVTGGNGTIRFAYLPPAKKTETITAVRMICGSTAASGDATVSRIGVWEVGPTGDLTPVASTPHDATLFTAAGSAVTKALTSSFVKTKGKTYVAAHIIVGATTPPNYAGQNGLASAEQAQPPRRSASLSGQTNLPTDPIPAGSLANTNQLPYVVLVS